MKSASFRNSTVFKRIYRIRCLKAFCHRISQIELVFAMNRSSNLFNVLCIKMILACHGDRLVLSTQYMTEQLRFHMAGQQFFRALKWCKNICEQKLSSII